MSNFTSDLIVTIPHSGEIIPVEATWLKGLPEELVMADVDRFVDQLYAPAIQKLRLDALIAQCHRYVIDLNRFETDIDQGTVQNSPLPDGQFSRGLHWKMTTQKELLMPQPMSENLHQQLVDRYFHPFHKELQDKVKQARTKNPLCQIFHLDLHSMPSVGTSEHKDPGQNRPDIVLSDQKGKSADPLFLKLVQNSLQKVGFQVQLNWPYIGGRITERYGQPQRGHHTLQIELNRKLYMDEVTKQPLKNLWPDLQQRLLQFLDLVQIGVQSAEIR